MDSLDIGTFKFEKAQMSQRSNISKVGSFIRAVEVCIVLVLILRLSTQVPSTVKSSGEYFRGLKSVFVSPIFVFVLGNMIVFTLFAKSGKLSGHDSSTDMDHYSKECADTSRLGQSREAEAPESRRKICKRARSEKFSHKKVQKLSRGMRQSKSEKNMVCSKSSERSDNTSFPEEAMSNEEFRRTIEDFIARQQKFRMEEEKCAT